MSDTHTFIASGFTGVMRTCAVHTATAYVAGYRHLCTEMQPRRDSEANVSKFLPTTNIHTLQYILTRSQRPMGLNVVHHSG